MFSTVVQFVNILVILQVSLAALCCILLIKLPMKFWVKYLVIPFVIVLTYMGTVTSEGLFGKPYEVLPQGKFTFKAFRVVSPSAGTKKIEIWVIQDGKSRLHVIEYTAKREQAMIQAENGTLNGKPQEGTFEEEEDGKGKAKGDSNGGGYDTNPDVSFKEKPLHKALPPKQ